MSQKEAASLNERLAGLPDAALTSLLLESRGAAQSARHALQLRHLPAATLLAGLLCPDPGQARELAAAGFTEVVEGVRRNGTPRGSWRLAVLRATAKAALAMFGPPDTEARTNRCLDGAYALLTSAPQGTLWHVLVEQDPPERVSRILGLPVEDIGQGLRRARSALRDCYLDVYRDTSPSDGCRAHLGLLRASTERVDVPPDPAVTDHLASCSACVEVVRTLVQLERGPGPLLACVLLGSPGAGYFGLCSERRSVLGQVRSSPLDGATANPSPHLNSSISPDSTDGRRRRGADPPVEPEAPRRSKTPVQPGRHRRAAFLTSPRLRRIAAVGSAAALALLAAALGAYYGARPSSSSPPPNPSPATPPHRVTVEPPASPATPAPQNSPGPVYAPFQHLATGRCLSAVGPSSSAERTLAVRPCDVSPAQLWNLDRTTGLMRISDSPETCLAASGHRAVLSECPDSLTAKSWPSRIVEQNGVVRLASDLERVLSVTVTASGQVAFRTRSENRSIPQLWRQGIG